MKTQPDEVLSMLIDGEAVAGNELVAALDQPDALETLRSFVRLRLAIEADTAVPDLDIDRVLVASSHLPVEAMDGSSHQTRHEPTRLRRRAPLVISAAVVGAAVAATLLLIVRPSRPSNAEASKPPRPEVVVRFHLDQRTQ